jgi:hypothetical protein
VENPDFFNHILNTSLCGQRSMGSSSGSGFKVECQIAMILGGKESSCLSSWNSDFNSAGSSGDWENRPIMWGNTNQNFAVW